MTRQEQLQENYEDALFTLLMNQVAQVQGRKALEENRVLRENPDGAVPQDVRRACLKAINRAFRKKRARTAGSTTVRILKTVALVALLGALILSAAFAAFPAFRIGTLNMVIDALDEGVSFHFASQSEPVSEQADLEDLYPSILPVGYEVVEDNSYAGSHWVYYKNEQGDRLEIYLSANGTFDTENAELESIQIHGLPAYLIDQSNVSGDKHGVVKVLVLNEAEGYILSVISAPHSTVAPAPITGQGIIRIAESIFE